MGRGGGERREELEGTAERAEESRQGGREKKQEDNKHKQGNGKGAKNITTSMHSSSGFRGWREPERGRKQGEERRSIARHGWR